MNKKDILNLIDSMTLEEKASLICGERFFASREIKERGIPAIRMLDGGTGINFEQLFGDRYKELTLDRGYTEVELDNVIRNFYKEQNLSSRENELREIIYEDLLEFCHDMRPSPGCYPPGILLASTWDKEVINQTGKALGLEARFYNQNILLGTPNINILRDVRNGRFFEGYSEDPYLTSCLGAELVKGVESQGVASNIKHFAANNLEINRIGINEIITNRALREIYLPAFKKCVEAGASTVMASYPAINGTNCTENHWLLTEVLRDEWGFDGLIMTDWGACTTKESNCVRAGLDLIMPGPWKYDEIIEAYNNGDLSEDSINRAAANIINASLSFKNEGLPPEISYEEYISIGDEAAYKAAASGIIMLKNSDNSFPVDSQSKFVVFGNSSGELLDYGGGSAQVFTDRKYGICTYLENSRLNDYEYYKSSDSVAIVVCSVDSCEGSDRTDINLPVETIEIITKLRKLSSKNKIALVLNTPSPVDLRDVIDLCDGIFLLYYPGMMGAKALSDILTGKINPSGKLTVTYPKRIEDIPSYYNYPDGFVSLYGENIYVGYRGFEKKNTAPLFPFGYGLSYSEFALTDVDLDKSEYSVDETIKVSFTLENKGAIEGETVVQIYIGDPISFKDKPIKELKAFGKYKLSPLESRRFELIINVSDLASYDEEYEKFLVEDGLYDLYIGFDSLCDKSLSFRVTDGCEEYALGINSTVKTISEIPSLYDALEKNIIKLGLDLQKLISCKRYTPFMRINDVYDNADIFTDFISVCRDFIKN